MIFLCVSEKVVGLQFRLFPAAFTADRFLYFACGYGIGDCVASFDFPAISRQFPQTPHSETVFDA